MKSIDEKSEKARLALAELSKLIDATTAAAEQSEGLETRLESLLADRNDTEGTAADVYDRGQGLIRDREICKIQARMAEDEHSTARRKLVSALSQHCEPVIEGIIARRQSAFEEVKSKLEPMVWKGGLGQGLGGSLKDFASTCIGVGDRDWCIYRMRLCMQGYIGHGSGLESLKLELENAMGLV